MDRWLSHWWGRDMVVGVIASIAMALYMMVAMAVSGLGFWTFPNVIAAMLPFFSPPTAAFAPLPSLVGLALHLAGGAMFAVAYGMIAWAMAPAMSRDYRPAIITGTLYAALIYVVFGRLIGPAIDPAIGILPYGHYLAGYLIFGLITTTLIVHGVRHREARKAAVTFAPPAPVEAPVERP